MAHDESDTANTLRVDARHAGRIKARRPDATYLSIAISGNGERADKNFST